jgi:hypothetical protein
MNRFFDPFIIFVILFNTFCITLDKYPSFSDDMTLTLVKFNYFFTTVFLLESVLKVIGFGIKEFI